MRRVPISNKTAAMKSKLTDSSIRSYKPRAKPYSIGDTACPGLRLQITPKGIKTFAIVYRDKGTGKVVWLTVGRQRNHHQGERYRGAGLVLRSPAAHGFPLLLKGVP